MTAAPRHPSLQPLKRGLALTSVVAFAVLFGFSARHAVGSNGGTAQTPTTEEFFQGGEDYGIDGTPSQSSPPAAQSRAS